MKQMTLRIAVIVGGMSLVAADSMAGGGATAPAGAAKTTASLTGLTWMVGKRGNVRLGGRDIEQTLKANPYLSGVFLGSEWNELEPKRGVFEWKALDERAAAARREGRYYELTFKPGTGTPDWVYASGVAVFEALGPNPYRKATYKKPLRIPIPWDPAYLKEFETFVRAAGERYSDDPSCASVAITGANFQSSESHLPKGPQDMEKWDALGYRDKLAKAYERYIDIFAAAFPRQQLCQHISTAVRNNDGVIEKAVAYGAARYPERFTLQNCQLSGKSDNTGLFSYALIQRYVGRLHVGYQSLAYLGEGERGARMGEPRTAVCNFVAGRGEYWELWDGNGRDPAICKWLTEEIARARRPIAPSSASRLIATDVSRATRFQL